MTGWICFEDETAKNWGEHRFGQQLHGTTTLDSWLDRLDLERLPSDEEENTFFSQVLPAPLHGELDLWKSAVLELRQAGVESTEHADYLFSQLPVEPKNQLLHFLVGRYLEAMGWNAQARLRIVAEQIRSLLIVPPGEHLVFVHGLSPQAAFREIADAFSKAEGVREVEFLGPLEIPRLVSTSVSPTYRRVPAVLGSVFQRLDRIAARATRVSRRGKRCEVFMACEASAREYLKWKLSAQGTSFADFCEEPAKSEARHLTRHTWVSTVRGLRKWKIAKRLQLEKRISRLAIASGSREEWVAAYAGVFSDGLLAEVPLENHSRERKKAPPSLVSIFPWTGKISSNEESLFFEQPAVNLAPPSILTVEERRAMVRLGFGATSREARSIQTATRPVLLLSDAGLRKLPEELGLNVRRARLRSLPVAHSPALLPMQGAETPKRAPSLSATSTRSYLECPSKYFFQHAMGLYAEKDPRTDTQLYFGVLAHKALELFFRPKMDPALKGITLEEAFDAAYAQTIRENSPWLRKEILHTLFTRVSSAVPDLEAQLDTVFGRRSVFGIEYEFRIEWEGVVLKGRIDRVDRLGDGSLLLIDYKTGSVDFTPAHVGTGKDLQPWFYLRAVSDLKEPRAGILYYDLKGHSVSRGMLLDRHVEKKNQKAFTRGHVVSEETWERLIADGETQVKNVVKGLKESRLAPTPSTAHCQFCDYFLHCRASAVLEGA